MPKRARKKPVEIEYVVWRDHRDDAELQAFAGHWVSIGPDGPFVTTSEGVMRASFGDVIIKGVKGEFYHCKPDIFAASYAPLAPCGFNHHSTCTCNGEGGDR